MLLSGKGFWIWIIRRCEGGIPSAIANAAQAAGYTHVPVKIADGSDPQNLDPASGADLVPAVTQELRARGIQVWGWHYVYGDDPRAEAAMAIARLSALNLDGYIIDAEQEYKLPGREQAARLFMSEMRKAFPNLPMALSSYRFPTYHPQLPWSAFLEKCDLNMPQVYWEQAHNPAEQLARSVNELLALNPSRPVIPTGPTYKVSGWRPTEEDILEFLNKAKELNLLAANFFSWDECRRDLPNLWTVISNFNWNAPKDILLRYIDGLNAKDPQKMVILYQQDAVFATYINTLQGREQISQYYTSFFTSGVPNASFTIQNMTGTGSTRQLNWKAVSTNGKTYMGSDTFGILNDLITYHYSSYNSVP